jgi:enoyl-CoA hydratase/carnithine racemase
MRDALAAALATAEAEPAVRVEIDGNGPSFCSGGDLAEFGTVADVVTAHRLRLRRSAGRALAAVADRVTASVHGACVGAGVELAAFAGRVIARGDATFRLPEVGMGLVPGAGGTVSLPRRIGRQRTALLAITGTAIDAATARDWGLVDELET